MIDQKGVMKEMPSDTPDYLDFPGDIGQAVWPIVRSVFLLSAKLQA